MPPESDSPANRYGKALDFDEVDIRQRLAFLELTQADAEQLRGLRSAFADFADEFVEGFYRHLFAFEETRKFLQDPALVARLKAAQRAHFVTLLEARWDEEYVRQRQQVGQAHAEVEVQPQYFLGAYSQYVQHCFRQFAAAAGEPGDLEWMLSLSKAIFLDIGLALDAYFAHSTRALRQALDMLWRANHELRRFAQLTSHDLKTPMATVANLCDEAVDEFGDQMPAEARRLVEGARQGIFRMGRLIDELLSTTVVQSTESNDEIESREILDEALERLRPLLREKGVELVLPTELPIVWGNKICLREAFYNVLSNAAKFIPRGTGRIVIELQATEREQIFCIADNGPGIPAEELERVFVPFRRLPQHREQPGSGLGLYFAKSLIEDQGGRIWAECQPGQGARFYLAIKRKQGL